MNNRPLVSVIIPCYNVSDYIEKCMNSIMNQSYSHLEIIPVDDGGKDATPKILDELAKKDNRIMVIHKKNEGVSAARNTGLKAATGDYIVFVDGDDYLSEDFVEYMLTLTNIDNADVVLSKNCFIQHNQPQISCDKIETLSPPKATALLLSPRVMVGCWNKMYRRKFLEDNNLYFSTNLFYGEGLHFITKTTQLANKITVGEKMVYYYRRNNNMSATTKYNIDNHRNGEIAIDKIRNELIISDKGVLDMIDIHKSLFCMHALVYTYNSKLNCRYADDCRHWKRIIKDNLSKLLTSKELNLYRKILLLMSISCPKLYSKLNLLHRKRVVRLSVN